MDRFFRVEFRRGFYSLSLFLAVILIALAALSGIGELAEIARKIDHVKGSLRFLEITYQSLFSEALGLAIPIACTLGISASYFEDIENGTIYYILLRTTKRKYCWSKAINCALIGALSVALAFFAVVIACFAICPVTETELARLSEISVSSYYYLSWRVICLCLNGSFYALLGGVFSVIAKSKYMGYAAPFIFYYVLSTLFDAYLTKQRLINPREWMMAGTMSGPLVIVVLVAANVVALACYVIIIERRWQHD